MYIASESTGFTKYRLENILAGINESVNRTQIGNLESYIIDSYSSDKYICDLKTTRLLDCVCISPTSKAFHLLSEILLG